MKAKNHLIKVFVILKEEYEIGQPTLIKTFSSLSSAVAFRNKLAKQKEEISKEPQPGTLIIMRQKWNILWSIFKTKKGLWIDQENKYNNIEHWFSICKIFDRKNPTIKGISITLGCYNFRFGRIPKELK